MIERQDVELRGRVGAGIVESNDEWHMVRILGRIPIWVRKDDQSVSPCLVRDGYWESWITAWVLNQIDDDTLFIDIGANTGYYSLLARDAGAKVMAFEPNPKYVEMLRESIKIGWGQSRGDWLPDKHFNVYPWAISNEVGKTTLTIPSGLQGSATIRSDVDLSAYDPQTVVVQTNTLDRSLAGIVHGKLLIKVDAEGAEEMIWDGSQAVRSTYKPTFMLEYTPGAYSRDFLNKLETYGDIHWINTAGKEERISQSDILSYADWLMLVIRAR